MSNTLGWNVLLDCRTSDHWTLISCWWTTVPLPLLVRAHSKSLTSSDRRSAAVWTPPVPTEQTGDYWPRDWSLTGRIVMAMVEVTIWDRKWILFNKIWGFWSWKMFFCRVPISREDYLGAVLYLHIKHRLPQEIARQWFNYCPIELPPGNGT